MHLSRAFPSPRPGLLPRVFAVLALAAPLALCAPSASALQAGVDYESVSPAQRTSVGKGKVEVLEFFWYRCPHCFQLEPEFKAWSRKLPKNVVVKRVPGILSDKWIHLAKVYYALEALGLHDKLHGDVFNAIHLNGMNLDTPTAFFDWAVTKGVERKKIEDAYNSFGVNSKVMQAQALTKAYKLSGVPAFAVNGKYTTSAYLTKGEPALFAALDALVKKEASAGKR